MRLRSIARWGLVAATAIGFLGVSARGKAKPEPGASGQTAAAKRQEPGTLKDEIPGGELAAVMAAHYKGLGMMEQYQYHAAAAEFRDVVKRAPGWIPGSINLAIALLNDSESNAEEALDLLAAVLARDPDNPYAHFNQGLILRQLGREGRAHCALQARDRDRSFGRGRLVLGGCDDSRSGYGGSGSRRRTDALKEKSKKEILYFTKAVELNPYFTPAVYRMAMAARFTMGRKEGNEWFQRYRKINPDQADSAARARGVSGTVVRREGEIWGRCQSVSGSAGGQREHSAGAQVRGCAAD